MSNYIYTILAKSGKNKIRYTQEKGQLTTHACDQIYSCAAYRMCVTSENFDLTDLINESKTFLRVCELIFVSS